VTITVKARSAQGAVSGVKQVSGGLGASQLPPVVAPGGIVNAAAPGSIITISGDQLADGESSYSSVPVGTQLAGATVLIADQAVPLLMASPQQINIKGIVPYGIEVNTTHQVLVQRGLTYGRPVEIDMAAAQPAIGLIVDGKGVPVDPANPAKAGSAITDLLHGAGRSHPGGPGWK